MRRAGRGSNEQARCRGLDDAIPSAPRLDRRWAVGNYVKLVGLAACSIAISILLWSVRPGRPQGPHPLGHNPGSRNSGFVFPMYQYYQPYPNGSRVVRGRRRWRGGREGNGRGILSENPFYELHGSYQGPDDLGIDTNYIEVKLGDPPKPFYFDVDTGSGTMWVQCSLDGSTLFETIGPNGLFMSSENSIVKCIGETESLCDALQDDFDCGEADNYECKFSIEYGDGSRYTGFFVKESITIPMLDKTERNVFVGLGCALSKRTSTEEPSLQTDGLIGLGRCDGSLVDLLGRSNVIQQKVVGVCLAKEPRRRRRGLRPASRVGFVSLGIDFEEKFARSQSAWVKMVGQEDDCVYNGKLLSITIGNRRITAPPGGNAGMALGFDTGSAVQFFRKDVYDQVLGALETFTTTRDYVRVRDSEFRGDAEQRVCWKYRGRKRKHDSDPLAASAIHGFGTLNFGLEGIDTTELQYLIVRPENYLDWDVATRKLCVNIIQDRAMGRIDLGAHALREHLFVFDIENQRFRWKQSTECEL